MTTDVIRPLAGIDGAPGYGQQVREYFAAKAAAYDLVEQQIFWRLSDSLLWRVLSESVLSALPPGFSFLDAGGGTGRWSSRLLGSDPRCRGVLYDISPEMAARAAQSAAHSGYEQRLAIRLGDLNEPDPVLLQGSFDLVISFHNVIGFVRDPEATISRLASLLRPGGWLALFAPNAYHAAYFNLLNGQIAESAEAITAGWGKYVPDMPGIHLFTPQRLTAACERAGLEVGRLTGFPLLLYPGYEETRLLGSTTRVTDLLRDEDSFQAILELESQAARHEEVAARGTNIFVAGQWRGEHSGQWGL